MKEIPVLGLQECSIRKGSSGRIPGLCRRTGLSVLFFIMLIPNRATCQESKPGDSRHKIGLHCGFGDQDWKIGVLDLSIDVNYTYEVYFLQLQYCFSLLPKKNWGVDLLCQPQYNFVRLKIPDDSDMKRNGYEFGLNIGFAVRRNFFDDKFSLYLLVSSGPHFISNAPTRQASGFIFSDNVSLGVSYRITNKIYLDFRPGFRHVSNASIKRPNGGINTHTCTSGIMIVL